MAHSVGQPVAERYPPRGIGERRVSQSVGVSEGSGDVVSDSLGDSLGSLGDSLGSLGLSLGDWLGSLGDSPGSLGDSVGLPVGRGSDGTCVGRAGTGEVEPSSADSSTERGLAGTDSATSGASLPGLWLDGSLCDGFVDDFSSGATGETGEIRLTPDSSVA